MDAQAPRIGVAVLGGGKGTRFGGVTPKPVVHVLGHPLIYYSIKLFASMSQVVSTVITFPEDEIPMLEKALQPYGEDRRRKIIAGGATRAHSALKALEALMVHDPEIVIIHDAVRPCISMEDIDNLLAALEGYDGAFLGAYLSDTIWCVENNVSKEIVPREGLVRAFTPQAFHFKAILEAMNKGYSEGFEGTDDASYVVRNGGKVVFVPSSSANIKVTYSKDLEIVEALLGGYTCA
jgi:2-C-methyl-D-erythritol 4-phosphate cytidylyltransferase